SFSPAAAMGQDTALSPPSSDYVSRAEYDKLKSEHEAMKQELDALKAAIQKMTAGGALAPAPGKTISEGKQVVAPAPTEAATEEPRQEAQTLKMQEKEPFPAPTEVRRGGRGTAASTTHTALDPCD